MTAIMGPLLASGRYAIFVCVSVGELYRRVVYMEVLCSTQPVRWLSSIPLPRVLCRGAQLPCASQRCTKPRVNIKGARYCARHHEVCVGVIYTFVCTCIRVILGAWLQEVIAQQVIARPIGCMRQYSSVTHLLGSMCLFVPVRFQRKNVLRSPQFTDFMTDELRREYLQVG